MKRYVLFLGLVLGTSTAAWAGLASQLQDSVVYILDPQPNSPITSMRVGTPVNVAITPRLPHPSDEVFVTITGWKSCADYDVDHVGIWLAGHDVMVDLYWVAVPVPPPPPPEPQPTVGLITRPQPHVAYSDVAVVPVPPGPGQQPGKYEITRSLGTFDPGTYTVYVTNHGPVTGDTSASFTVVPESGLGPGQYNGNPWLSWLLNRPGRHEPPPAGGLITQLF